MYRLVLSRGEETQRGPLPKQSTSPTDAWREQLGGKQKLEEPGDERQKARKERLDKLVVLQSKLGKQKDRFSSKDTRAVAVKSFNCDHLPLLRESKEEKMKRIITSSLNSIKENRKQMPKVEVEESESEEQFFKFLNLTDAANLALDRKISEASKETEAEPTKDKLMHTSCNSNLGLEAELRDQMMGFSILPSRIHL